MNFRKSYILALLALVFVACSKDKEEPDNVSDDTPMEVSAHTCWQCGRTMGVTRAITDPVGTVDGDKNSIQFPDALYPEWLHITMWDGGSVDSKSPLLVRQTFGDNDNYETLHFVAYHDTYALNQYNGGSGGTKSQRFPYSKSQVARLVPEANTLSSRFVDGIPQAWDDQDIPTIGTTDHMTTKTAFGGSYRVEGSHLFLTLGHVTALLRLHFAVAEQYDRIRFIDLKNVTINGEEITHEAHLILPVATTEYSLFGYAYVKPSHDYNGTSIPATWTNPVSAASTSLTFECTYDIYDKDAGLSSGVPTADQLTAASSHFTRPNVVARNTIRLNNLKDAGGSTISVIKAGHYYDLYITIDPAYLYVLSDHDNQHMTIQ